MNNINGVMVHCCNKIFPMMIDINVISKNVHYWSIKQETNKKKKTDFLQ